MTVESVPSVPTYTTFQGHRRIAFGPLATNALAVKKLLVGPSAGQAGGAVLTFSDATGRPVDIDIRGSDEDVLARLATGPEAGSGGPAPRGDAGAPALENADVSPRGRGRPRLGVVAREVTLLPRHWDWLGTQPGGASVALRKLVEEARRKTGDKERKRQAQERAYHFMSAMAGDFPGFEEASRALFAGDTAKFEGLLAPWPADVREHLRRLASDEERPGLAQS